MIRTALMLLALLGIPAFSDDGHFVSAGKMSAIRMWGHTATLLKDGRVLLTGGKASSSVELFDPSTGAFRAAGSLTTRRYYHQAGLLPDGRVLIEGGYGGDGPGDRGQNSREIYDPVTETSTLVDSANPLPAGIRVLLDVVLYDAATGTFSPFVGSYVGHTVTFLSDGRLALVGPDGIWIFENDGFTLAEKHSFGSSWSGRATALLPDGTVLIAGGDAGYYEDSTGEAFIFDPRNGTLRRTGGLLMPRGYSHQLTPLPDGTVLVTGGSPNGFDCVCAAEIYDPATGRFSIAGRTIDTRTATMLHDGRVLLTSNYEASLYFHRDFTLSATGRSGRLAPGSMGSMFGALLSNSTEAVDLHSPENSLAGVQIDVIDHSGVTRQARLLYVSPTRINFEVPADSLPGEVRYIVHSPEQKDREIKATLAGVAPSLFALAGNRAAGYAVRYQPDGRQQVTSAAEPIVIDEFPVYLTLYATGLRGAAPSSVICGISDANMLVEYAGPAGDNIPGLDQVNVELPRFLKGAGVVSVHLNLNGELSNPVLIDLR